MDYDLASLVSVTPTVTRRAYGHVRTEDGSQNWWESYTIAATRIRETYGFCPGEIETLKRIEELTASVESAGKPEAAVNGYSRASANFEV